MCVKCVSSVSSSIQVCLMCVKFVEVRHVCVKNVSSVGQMCVKGVKCVSSVC